MRNANAFIGILSFSFASSFGITESEASTVTLGASSDTYISSINPNVNYGSSDNIYLGRGNFWGLGSWRGLFEFDLSSITSQQVTSATFYWYTDTGGAAAGGLTNDLHQITSSWTENTATWQSQPTFDSTVISTTFIGDSFSRPGWKVWDVTSLAEGWADGSLINNGFLIKPDYEGNAGASRYDIGYSSEFSNEALRPYLELEIQAVPVPASFILLFSGCVFLAGVGNMKERKKYNK